MNLSSAGIAASLRESLEKIKHGKKERWSGVAKWWLDRLSIHPSFCWSVAKFGNKSMLQMAWMRSLKKTRRKRNGICRLCFHKKCLQNKLGSEVPNDEDYYCEVCPKPLTSDSTDWSIKKIYIYSNEWKFIVRVHICFFQLCSVL